MMKQKIWTLMVLVTMIWAGGALAQVGELVLGPDLVTNGTFDSDIANWNVSQGSWIGTDDADADPCSGCVALDQGDGGAYAVQYVEGVVPGKLYQFSYSHRAPTITGNMDYYPFVRCEDDMTNHTAIESSYTYDGTTTSTSTYFVPDGTSMSIGTEWQTTVIEVVPGPGATVFRIQFTPGGETREGRFDNFSLRIKEYLGPELVTNGNFDTDTTGWNAHLSEQILGDGAGPEQDPNGCLAMNQGDANAYALQFVDIEPDNTYRFVYYFKSPDAGAGVLWCYPWIRCEDAGSQVVTSDFTYLGSTDSTNTYYVPNGDHLEARTAWQRHRLDVTPAAGATKFRIQFAVSDSSEFRFDSFSLREVDPAPDDCAEVLDLGYSITGDINNDCRVNLADLSLMTLDWLKCIVPNDPTCLEPWTE